MGRFVSDVFISYRSQDRARVKPLVAALEADGLSVWWDAHIQGGAAWRQSIEAELNAARCVIVVWSQNSVGPEGEFVQDEASHARKRGVYLPIRIDEAQAPLGFRQVQALKMPGWKGDRADPTYQALLTGAREMVGGEAVAKAPAAPPARKGLNRRMLIVASGMAAAAALVLGALAGTTWLMRDRISPSPPSAELKIAVLPFETLSAGQTVRYFADSLQDEIVGVLSQNQIAPVSRSMSQELRGPGADKAIDKLGARLLLDGTVRADGDVLHVRVHLDDPRAHTTLWSREFEAPAKDATILQSQVAHRMIATLACSREALQPVGGLTKPDLIARYLHACDLFADWDVHTGYDSRGNAEWDETQRALTVQAPGFAPPFYLLAMGTALNARGAPREAKPGLRQEAQAFLDRGVALDPKSPMSYAVRQMLLPARQWGERERLLRQAVAAGPAHPPANYWIGEFLAETGRLREAAQFSQRSAAADMVYDWGIFSATIVCAGGQSKQATADIVRFRRLLPASAFAQTAHLNCLMGSGQWSQARRLLDSLPRPPGETPRQITDTEVLLSAASSRAPADLDKARRLALARAEEDPAALVGSITWLAALGFLDDAFRLTERYDPDAWPNSTNVFMFVPTTQGMRRDPRFMRVAARSGLVDYWRASGHWPDFCADRNLPYDCKAEAARLALTDLT